MDNDNKITDVLGSLSESQSKEKDFGTTVLHDVLGALVPKKEVKSVLQNPVIPELPELTDIPGFELPEIALDLPIIPKAESPTPTSHFDFNGLDVDINKKEKIENHLVDLQTENNKLKSIIATQKKEMDEHILKSANLDAENTKLRAELSNAKDNLRSEFEAQLNKAAIIEDKYNQLAERHEELKAKVRRDIRKIRLREKELTHKMELMKNDSETLLSAKDQKILQLKKYIDSLEFDIETSKEKIEHLEEKLKDDDEKAQRVVRALRLSTSLLETNAKKKII